MRHAVAVESDGDRFHPVQMVFHAERFPEVEQRAVGQKLGQLPKAIASLRNHVQEHLVNQKERYHDHDPVAIRGWVVGWHLRV